MPMTDEPPGRFLMTPAQHRQWAPAARHQMQEHIIDLRAATMSTVELLVVLYFLLVAVALLALYVVERRWRKGP
jgi:hypothetical protein